MPPVLKRMERWHPERLLLNHEGIHSSVQVCDKMKFRKTFFVYRSVSETGQNTVSWKKSILGIGSAALYIVVLYTALQLVDAHFFSVQVWSGTLVRDLAAHIMFGLLLYSIARSWIMWALSFSLLATVLQITNALKLNVLGSPLMPDDFLAFTNMLHLFSDWRQPAMIAAVGLPVILLIVSIAWKHRSTWILFLCGIVAVSLLFTYAGEVTAYMDKQYGDWVWNQPGNYKQRGLIRHIIHEGIRNVARSEVNISRDDTLNALDALQPGILHFDSSASLNSKPNIYMILLESFWDPMLLTFAGIHPDPVDPRFRRLWSKAAQSTAMSPVFGGYTANTEFEALCGFPVTENAVFFEGRLRNEAPCLPRYLKGSGYTSIAAHPNYAAFWNRVNAYQRIGFDHYWSQNDFSLDDMNREFLSDASLYRQVLDKLKKETIASPYFAYIVTFFGHLDYPLSESRPEVIDIGIDNRMLKGYVNQIYYKSKELMDFVEQLQKIDPDAIIVFYGDHLPYLGPNHDCFVQQGLFTKNKSDFDAAMFRNYVTTPLILLNGRKGPVQTGSIPMYQLPARLLAILDDAHHGFAETAQSSQLQYIRPLAGLSLYAPQHETPVLCKQGTEHTDSRCTQILHSTAMLTTLRDDLFTADQFSLTRLVNDGATDEVRRGSFSAR